MNELPAELTKTLSPTDVQAATAWWAGLSDASRSEVASLCRPGRGTRSFARADSRPVVIGGRFVAPDDTAGWDEWNEELFDYLLCNPELVLSRPTVVRTFHICTSHELARKTLAAGRIPADFRCPFDSQDCPMRGLLSLAPGKSLQLTGARSCGRGVHG